ncbi:hypothetical protein BC834DRAFT_792762, partial [Gloeopeniophorella convolvens]
SSLLSIPRLLPNGANWVTYKSRITTSLGSRGLLHRHLDGCVKAPAEPAAPAKGATKDEKEEYEKAMVAYELAMDDWETWEFIVKQQLLTTLSDMILIRIQHLNTAQEMWEALRSDFEGRTQAVVNDL